MKLSKIIVGAVGEFTANWIAQNRPKAKKIGSLTGRQFLKSLNSTNLRRLCGRAN